MGSLIKATAGMFGITPTSRAPSPDPSIGQAQTDINSNASDLSSKYTRGIYQPGLQQASDQSQNVDTYRTQLNSLNQNTGQYGKSAYGTMTGALSRGNQFAQQASDYTPLYKQIAQGAGVYGSNAYAAQQAQQASDDVNTEYKAQQASRQRQMSAYGLDPSSTAFQDQQRASDVTNAANRALAANQAYQTAQPLAWQRQLDAAGIGGALGTTANASYSTGLNAGALGLNTNNQLGTNYSAGLQAGQIPLQNYLSLGQGLTQANTTAGNQYIASGQIGMNLYPLQLQRWNMQNNADAQNAAGYGTAIGTLIGHDWGSGSLTPEEQSGVLNVFSA